MRMDGGSVKRMSKGTFGRGIFFSLLFLAALFMLYPMHARAGQWQEGSGKDAGKWWYNNLDGSHAAGGWYWIEGNYDGVAECYYFDEAGWLVTSTVVDGRKVNANGAWVEGGIVQTKSSEEADVSTNGLNELSTGTIELGSDMDLGTEIKIEDLYAGPVKAEGQGNARAGEAQQASRSGDSPVGADGKQNVIEAGSSVSAASGSSVPADGVEIVSVSEGPGTGEDEEDGNEAPHSLGTKSENTESTAAAASSSAAASGDIRFTGRVGSSDADLPKTGSISLVEYARSYIGILPYVTAGTSLETGADCSGFVQQIFKRYNINIPRDSRSQYAASRRVSVEELRAGDLIFYGSSPSTIYHVGIYSGNGTIIHCTHTGDYVRESSVFYAKPYGYGRYLAD